MILKKPWLLLPPLFAHQASPYFLRLYRKFRNPQTYCWKPFTWRGIEFANPLGIAAGLDKDGEYVDQWWAFGPGFLEVGTVVPKVQDPNAGKIMDRHRATKSLWNKLGFPSEGAEYVRENLAPLPLPHFSPLFVNIGKNRDTPNERAADDYCQLIEAFYGIADAFVVNISSPNTAGLRDLLSESYLEGFLKQLMEKRDEKAASEGDSTPILLKLSPDLDEEQLERCLSISAQQNVDGWVLTNTTLARPAGVPFPPEGGLSGAPLAQKSKEMLSKSLQILGPHRLGRLIVSVGGVMSPQDVFERLEMGADLVEVYSALVYEGPFFFRQTYEEATVKYATSSN